MDGGRDFTISADRFGGLPEYVKELKAQGIKFMTILASRILLLLLSSETHMLMAVSIAVGSRYCCRTRVPPV